MSDTNDAIFVSVAVDGPQAYQPRVYSLDQATLDALEAQGQKQGVKLGEQQYDVESGAYYMDLPPDNHAINTAILDAVPQRIVLKGGVRSLGEVRQLVQEELRDFGIE